MGETRNQYRLFVRKPERKRPLRRRKRRWVDNIKINLAEIGWDGVDWINLTQDKENKRAHVNAAMNLRIA
jgi:hypothetical protein